MSSGSNARLVYLRFELSLEYAKFVSWSHYKLVLVLGIIQQNELCSKNNTKLVFKRLYLEVCLKSHALLHSRILTLQTLVQKPMSCHNSLGSGAELWFWPMGGGDLKIWKHPRYILISNLCRWSNLIIYWEVRIHWVDIPIKSLIMSLISKALALVFLMQMIIRSTIQSSPVNIANSKQMPNFVLIENIERKSYCRFPAAVLLTNLLYSR